MHLEKLVDPYGFGVRPGTPEEAANSNEPIPTPEHAAGEQMLAAARSVDVLVPGEEARSSDLDLAMRLQDAPDTWLGGGEVSSGGEGAAQAAIPEAPLEESGDQGL